MNFSRFASLSAVVALAACSGGGPTQQTESIPAGSGTLAAGATRVEQRYVGTLAASGDSRSTRPHWTFVVDAKLSSTGVLGEGPHVRLSLLSDQSTIPVTQDITLTSGSGTSTATVEFDSECTSNKACSQGVKARFDRKDTTGTGDIAVTWTGTLSTKVTLPLGQIPPGDLSIATE